MMAPPNYSNYLALFATDNNSSYDDYCVEHRVKLAIATHRQFLQETAPRPLCAIDPKPYKGHCTPCEEANHKLFNKLYGDTMKQINKTSTLWVKHNFNNKKFVDRCRTKLPSLAGHVIPHMAEHLMLTMCDIERFMS